MKRKSKIRLIVIKLRKKKKLGCIPTKEIQIESIAYHKRICKLK